MATEQPPKKTKKALPYQSTEGFLVPAHKLVIIGLDTKDTEKTHDLYNAKVLKPLKPGFVQNIARYGQLKPVLAVKNGKTPEGEDILVVVDGRKRVRAIRAHNEELAKTNSEVPPLQVKTILVKGDPTRLSGIMVSANVMREEENLHDQINLAMKLLETTGHTKESVAETFGVTKETIDRWSKIYDLHPSVKEAVTAGKIGMTAAIKLHDHKRESQPKLLKELLGKAGKVTSSNINRKIHEVTTKTKVSPPPSKSELRKIVAAYRDQDVLLSDDLALAIEVILGDVAPNKHTALFAALKHIRRKK